MDSGGASAFGDADDWPFGASLGNAIGAGAADEADGEALGAAAGAASEFSLKPLERSTSFKCNSSSFPGLTYASDTIYVGSQYFC